MLITFFFFAIYCLWIFRIIHNIFSYTQLWYVKEHRLDRMWIHLSKTAQGKWILFPKTKLPPVTPKTFVLVIGSVCLLGVFGYMLYLNGLPFVIILFVLDLGTFPLTALFEVFLFIPTIFFHTMKIRKAVQKLRQHPPSYVIGITGSYGKTSVKAYLHTIVSQTHRALTTEGSVNSPIGIAERILSSDLASYDVLIAEMGAYKRGEICNMSDMVKPSIAILTAINAQHQDLFGSIENTKSAKFELLESLPETGIAIVNADTPHSLSLGKRAKDIGKTVWLYTSKTDHYSWADEVFRITDVRTYPDRVTFVLHHNRDRNMFEASVLGTHQAHNITAAILAARSIGMGYADISNGIKQIKPFQKTMEKYKGFHGSTFINDTFNNNPDASIAALSYISMYTGKRIFVFQPMIELGAYSESGHRDVGKKAGEIADTIILTNSNFYTPFMEGVRLSQKNPEVHVMQAKVASALLKRILTNTDCVLFKGKEAEIILRLTTDK